MQEDGEDAQWAYEAYHKHEDTKETPFQGAPIGEFIPHHFLGHIPTQEDASNQGTYRHEQLSGEVVAIGEEILAEETKPLHCSLRERANHTDDTTNGSLYPGALLAAHLSLLIEERRSNLVHGDGGSQCCQHQQGIEQHGDDISGHRRIAKCLLEHVG